MEELFEIVTPDISDRVSTHRTEFPRIIHKPWGHELIWAWGEHYAAKIIHIEAGYRLSLQYHRLKEETLLLVRGRLTLELQGLDGATECYDVFPGQVFHIFPGHVHRMTALVTCDVWEVSTPELEDVVRLQDDFGRASAQIPVAIGNGFGDK